MPTQQLVSTVRSLTLGAAAALFALGCTPAAHKPGQFQIQMPEKLSALSAADAANLHATVEIPGVLGESELEIARDLKTATGQFTVDVTKAETRAFTLKLTWRPDETNVVLLGRLTGTIDIAPHKDNTLKPAGAFDTCGNAQPPCTLEFDLNRNGKSNLDDLAQDPSIDPRPPPPFVDVAPSDLAFPSGIALGTVSRDVIVVENTSAHTVNVSARLIDAPGATLALFNDDAAQQTSGAVRQLDLGTLAPFEQVLVAVTFAPVNKFLTVGDVFVTATDPATNVAQATRVRVLANVDGQLQPPDKNFTFPDNAPQDVGGNYAGHVELFSKAQLFNGLPVTSIVTPDSGKVSGLPSTGATLTATFAEGAETIPADHAYFVPVPANHKLSVSLAGLTSDIDLSVLLLDANHQITGDPQKNQRSTQSGTSAEAIELNNDLDAEVDALIVLGRVDVAATTAGTPGALTATQASSAVDVAPFSLSAHVTSAPEFTHPLSPSGGPLEGGSRVTLIGKRFDPNATVTFADAVALDCIFTALPETKETEFDCTTPPGSLDINKNPANIVVVDPAEDEGGDGQAATFPAGFTYEPPAPRLDQLLPAAAPTTGSAAGDAITLKGAFFSQRNGPPKVFFDGVEATPVTFVDSTKIQVPAPAHPITGTDSQVIVVVDVQNVLDPDPSNPGGVHLSLASNPRNFTYVTPTAAAPTLASVAPSSGAIDGGNTITLTGTGFLPNATVLLDGQKATNVNVLGSTSLQCAAPARDAAGSVDVEVINVDGQRASLSGGYAYIIPDPTVDSAFPTTATTDGGTFVVIAGSGFRAGVAVNFVDQSGTAFASPNVNRVSTTSILAASPQVPAEGAYTLQVQNVDGHSAALAAAFQMVHASGPKPRIDSIAPNTGNKDVPQPVTLTGANFRAIPNTTGPALLVGSTAAQVTGLDCNDTGSQCTLTAVFPTAPNAGPVVVRLIDDDGQSDTTVFTYFQQLGAPPVFDTLSPTTASKNDTLTITGRGFDVVDGGPRGTTLASDARLIVGGLLVQPLTASSTSLTVSVPDLDASVSGVTQVAVELTNSDGQSTSATFQYVPRTLAPSPVIQSVAPGVAHVGDAVVVSGANFDVASVQVGAVVLTPGAGVDATKTDAAHVAFTMPDPGVALPAVVSLTVRNNDGSSASTTIGAESTFTAPPTITAIAPTTVQVGGTVTISGSNLSQQGALTVGGAQVTATVAQNGALVSFTAPQHSDGTVAVVFTNPDGQAATTLLSFTSQVTPPPPNAPAVITSIAPSNVSTAGGDVVTLTGSNFVDVGGVLKVAGAIVGQRTVNAAKTQVTFTAPASASSGVVTVTWENANAAAASIFLSYSAPAAVQTAAPAIDSIAPDNGDVAGGTEVALLGSNFDPSDVVTIAGQAVSFTFNDPTSLSFVAPSAAAASTVSVRVTDANGNSAATLFRYTSGAQNQATPAVALLSPDVVHAFVPGDIVQIVGQNLEATTAVTIESAAGQPLTPALVQAASSVSVTVELTNALPDTDSLGGPVHFRLAFPDGTSVVSPPLTAAPPRISATFGDPFSSPQVTFLGDHLNGALAVSAFEGPSSVPVLSGTDSVLTTVTLPAAPPGATANFAVVYRDVVSGGVTPPIPVVNGPQTGSGPLPLVGEAFNEPMPANQAFANLTTVVDLQGVTTAPFGAPVAAHIVDPATNLDVATGSWVAAGLGFSGGDRLLLTLSAPAPVAPGNYLVRLESTESPNLVSGFGLRFDARAVAALVPSATTDRGGPVGGVGTVFAGDVVVAEDVASGVAQSLGTVTTSGCVPAVRGCMFAGAFEIPAAPGLTDGSFRICVVAPGDPVACPQSPTVLTVSPPATTTFDYTSQNCRNSTDHESLPAGQGSGDDRGGIAANTSFGYYTGDEDTARFNPDLSFVATPGRQLDGIFNDTASGRIFNLFNAASAAEPHTFNGAFVVDSIEELDPTTLNQVAVTPLSQTIQIDTNIPQPTSGMFAGDDELVLFESDSRQWFHIQISTGAVTNLGPHPVPNAFGCESWAAWGVARRNASGDLVVDYVGANSSSPTNDIRTLDLVTDVETVTHQFGNLGDMCSITVVPSQNRWYWHAEGPPEFSTSQEAFGFCDLGTSGATVECGDGTCNGDVVIAPSVPGVPPNIAANVPAAETDGFRLVYDLGLPDDGVFAQSGVPYSLDESGLVPPGSYDRIAYYFELSAGTQTQFVWVATDAFTPNAAQIGVPTFQSGAVFQQILTNTDVVSNVVTNGTALSTTNIEFWPTNYEPTNGIGIQNASDGAFDFGDLRDASGDYGSMQIHNFGTGETLFAYNHWNQAGIDDVGIGTNTGGGQPDYTFVNNANQFSLKHLQVLVHATQQGTPEDFKSCDLDCAAVCGDGRCDSPVENDATCPSDCGGVRLPPP